MEKENYDEFRTLVQDAQFVAAAAFCHTALNSGADPLYWTTQLGYSHFLNYTDDDAYYNKSLSVFEDLVSQYPTNVNALFWLGYLYHILYNDAGTAKKKLQEALALDPDHPYANLVLAGLLNPDDSYKLLHRALKSQPRNFRVLRQMINMLIETNQRNDAEKTLKIMLTEEPYVELQYGIMNEYINDVLTGASHRDSWQEEARDHLRQLLLRDGQK